MNTKQATRNTKHASRGNPRISYLVSRIATLNQQGIGALIILLAIGLIIGGVIAFTTPQIRNLVIPQKMVLLPSPSPSPAYTEKQQLYLRNKETIKGSLNLNDEQFDLLVENAGKN